MWCCCLLHARATTCSATTRSGARPFATWSSHCERDLRNRMTDRQWETRLLAVLAAVLVVFGLVAVYGASSLVATGGGEVGADFALRQLVGAVVGGIVATWLARSDYHVWRRAAWPLLGVTALLLLIPLLPFTHRIAPTINGARRWVNLGVVTVQPSELAKLAAVVWTAMLAAKKGEQIRTFQRGLLPFLVILGPLVGLIFLEPNLSMALLVAILAGTVLFTAGARIGHFLLVGVGAAPLAFGAVASAPYPPPPGPTFLHPGGPPPPGARRGAHCPPGARAPPRHRHHAPLHFVRPLEPVRGTGGDGRLGEHRARAENHLMRRAECGMRN